MSELPWKYSWKQPCPDLSAIGGETMKAKMILVTLMICLMPLSYAFPQDNKTIEGEIGFTGVWFDLHAKEGGKAKFTEYRDLREDGAVFGRARLNLDTDKYFLNFDLGDFAYDTQYYTVDGGMWGKFKFGLFYDEIPHNITFDARTPFLGAGHDLLVGAPNPNFPLWNTFDYSILRRQYGGGFKVDVIRPFFLDFSFERENRDGIKPTGAAETSPGGRAFELPEPVEYVTNNLKVSAGYSKKPLFLSLNYIHSDFNNSNTSLGLPPNFNAPNAFSLPPDNTYDKGAFKGAVSLPFNSRFSTNVGFARGRSETSVVSLIGSGYTGKVDNVNYDFMLTSNPVRFLDIKAYYKYYKRFNKSDDPTGIADIFLNYNISTYGGELGFRLPAQFYLSGGYKYVKTERTKKGEDDAAEILPFNMDNILFVDLKWSGLDFLEARVGYENLDRDAHYRTLQSAQNLSKRFSYAAQNKNTVKAAVDLFPLENLNFGLEYRYKKIGYSDTLFGLRNTLFGLRSDKRHELDISADYRIGKIAKVYGYGDYGWIKFNQMQSAGGLPWEGEQWDKTWGYGIGAEFYVIPKKLTLIFQHDYVKSNGTVDFTLLNGLFGAGGLPAFPAANQDNIDITRWDDYTLYSFSLRAVYNFTKSLTAMVGYAYERFWYSDAQLNNYLFAPAGGTNAAFLTGAYKDQSYRANLVFGGVSFKF